MSTESISEADVLLAMESLGGELRFAVLQNWLRESRGGRLLDSNEKNTIARTIAKQVRSAAEEERRLEDEKLAASSNGAVPNILVFTAFSQDYSLGYICEHVNKLYCEKHGYIFRSYIEPYKEIMDIIAPKTHCTWYKVWLIRHILAETQFLLDNNIRYIMWIDADAVVIEHGIRIEEKIAMGQNRDLIIAEDMNPGCLINAGVMLIRTSAFSRALWDEVWACSKYDTVFFYEQSALMGCLKARREGLNHIPVFHSYLPGAPSGPKIFAHVAVLERQEFNTNKDGTRLSRKQRRLLRKSENGNKRKTNLMHYISQSADSSKINNDEGKSLGLDQSTLSNLVGLVESQLVKQINEGNESSDDSGSDVEPTAMTVEDDDAEAAAEASAADGPPADDPAKFIFHPAGMGAKLSAIKSVLALRGIVLPKSLDSIDSFRLLRAKVG